MSKPRFRTLDEFYKAIDILIDKLRAENRSEDAAKLDDLIHRTAWTTGSELLGELGLVLKTMKSGYSPNTSLDIKECLDFTVNHRKILGLGKS